MTKKYPSLFKEKRLTKKKLREKEAKEGSKVYLSVNNDYSGIALVQPVLIITEKRIKKHKRETKNKPSI